MEMSLSTGSILNIPNAVAANMPPSIPKDTAVDTGFNTNWPRIALSHVSKSKLTIEIAPNENGLANLIGQPMTEQAQKMAMYYINESFQNWCTTNDVHPANVTGHINHVNQYITEHVAHDETQDNFIVENRIRNYDVGLNGWISDYAFNRHTGMIEATVNVAELSYQEAMHNDITMNFRPMDPANIRMIETRWIDGHIQIVDSCDNFSDVKEIAEMNKLPPKRRKFRGNLIINVKSRADYTGLIGYTASEQKALDTLREMISESDFRKYLTHGFILVQGGSGLTYQVPRRKSHTKVWDNGQLVEEICIRISDPRIPLTDNVIAFKILLESDENAFRQLGNVYNMKKQAA